MTLALLSGKKLFVSGERKIEKRTEIWGCFHILLPIADFLTAALRHSLPSLVSSLPGYQRGGHVGRVLQGLPICDKLAGPKLDEMVVKTVCKSKQML
jgi:hypothetical protein